MKDMKLQAVEDMNSLPMVAEMQAEWRESWQAELEALEAQNLWKQNRVLEITLHAARKQVAEYHDKAREYLNLAWSDDSPYYKNRECNLASIAFETLEARLRDEIAEMEKAQRSIKRKLKKLGFYPQNPLPTCIIH